MTPTQKTQKTTTLKRIFLNTKRPYLASGGQKTAREDFRDKVFCVFLPPEAKSDLPLSENTQKMILKEFICI